MKNSVRRQKKCQWSRRTLGSPCPINTTENYQIIPEIGLKTSRTDSTTKGREENIKRR